LVSVPVPENNVGNGSGSGTNGADLTLPLAQYNPGYLISVF